MVSGLVTSPCDQLRIFSGEARLMRIASKSAIGFAISKGLDRYKVFLHFLRRIAAARGSRNRVASGQWLVTRGSHVLAAEQLGACAASLFFLKTLYRIRPLFVDLIC